MHQRHRTRAVNLMDKRNKARKVLETELAAIGSKDRVEVILLMHVNDFLLRSVTINLVRTNSTGSRHHQVAIKYHLRPLRLLFPFSHLEKNKRTERSLSA